VVLFDEVEKAHAEVLDVLLQVLDDGRLTDGKGRTVDFKNTVIVMTSNLGSAFLAEQTLREGAISEGAKRQVMEALRQHFRPEFVNRLDEVIVFHALGRDDLKQIIDIQLGRLLRRLEDRKLTVELTPAARDQLVDEGYDPVYGARPLKRTIQKRVLDPLATRLLKGELREGDHVVIDAGSPELSFARGTPARVH
jgi:ATP-dependent Clp protease ATP-binding subunit ClpB